MNELSGEGNIENMLFVEKGLRELASLKVFLLPVFGSSQDGCILILFMLMILFSLTCVILKFGVNFQLEVVA